MNSTRLFDAMKSRLRLYFQGHRRRFWTLLAFFLLFLILSTAAIVKLPSWMKPSEALDLMAATQDLHTLTSGSLVLSGLHPEEILREETLMRQDERGGWYEYSTEIIVGESFPLRGWLQGLEASLARAGAHLSSRREENGMVVDVSYFPPGKTDSLLVERLTVRFRPSREIATVRADTDRPRAAFIIDDLGQNPAHFRRLAGIGIPFTISVLPKLPYSGRTARQAAEHNMEILLHLPMEPVDFPEKRPGPGAIIAAMTDDEIRQQLRENIESVPGATGVNNHMGSRLTADIRAMETLMGELKEQGLFFLDSKTSPHTLAFDTAFRFEIPTAQRDIFLDAHDDEDFIRGQIRKLLSLAQREGRAIGIGHPYKNTLAVLEEMRGEILESGVELVPLSKLLVQKTDRRPKDIASREVDTVRGGD